VESPLILNFDEFVARATGDASRTPYDYQRGIADRGLPELLDVPTGAGKTAAVVLGWLWRRRFHPDPSVRAQTPARLVFCLPMRVLVEQTITTVNAWLDNLGTTGLSVYTLMGGEPRSDQAWRMSPTDDAIFVGTLDMLLSRALNRGYGSSRWSWPIDFALFNNDCHWVFDEVQLMGVALETSRQLEGLRSALGTVLPCSSTWMSATVDASRLATFDNPTIDADATARLTDNDRHGPLATRLNGTRLVQEVLLNEKSREASLASILSSEHRTGSLTIAVLNTVDTATETFRHLQKQTNADCVLLHSRFRPGDRQIAVRRALAPVDPTGPGRIIVSTQVIEAGVDISADLMFTEAAPWPSIVQRAGRCNRDGLSPDAQLLWAAHHKPGPYEAADLDRSATQLRAFEGSAVTPEQLATTAVEVTRQVFPILRRRDLVDLFDTTPDLTGNDVDVSRFIRESDDLDAAIAWWPLSSRPPEGHSLPGRDERCPVPIAQLRLFAKDHWADLWIFDHLQRAWRNPQQSDIRPGGILIADASTGGYTPESGWTPKSKVAVEPVVRERELAELIDDDLSTDDDPLSQRNRWVSLAEHLADVEVEAGRLVSLLPKDSLHGELTNAVITAGRLHDLGKVHPAFQTMLASTTGADAAEIQRREMTDQPWAKSGGAERAVPTRRYFRHELASALALLDPDCTLLHAEPERDLVVYLVAAHHGRVRLGIRSLPDEDRGDSGELVALGVRDGETLGAFECESFSIPETTLSLSTMTLGRDPSGTPSWSERALALRDREDIGPFRLAYLEMLVRIADWRASEAAEVAP
jgi:CRISPR-associated endonuclease/helicase Cas3